MVCQKHTQTLNNLLTTIVIQNAEQALRWLDSTYNGTVFISDDQVVAMAASKQIDRPEQADIVKKAVAIIAEERNSDALRAWATGTHDSWENDDLATAYSFFNIQDRASTLDPQVLETLVQVGINDDPSKEADYRRHFQVLLAHHAGRPRQVVEPDYHNPVGLNNMGNTCYLNSLLQFFYTVKPLRQLILEFPQHKIDLSARPYLSKTVDSQAIPKAVIQQSQDFAHELQGLFTDMATSPGPVVRPSWSLAAKLFERAPISGMNHRRSTIGGDLPNITSPTKSTMSIPVIDEVRADPGVFKNKTATSSAETLIDADPQSPDHDVMALDDDSTKDVQKESSKLQTDNASMDVDEAVPQLESEEEAPEPPPRPPPVPPRPMIGPLQLADSEHAHKDRISKAAAEEAAQQQDVDEAMGNVLFKLQCSVKDYQENGKLTDLINE
jgi:ubiquitin carboxyl-terminal hydrolase 25/28